MIRCKIAVCDDFQQSSYWIPDAIPTDANGVPSKCKMYSRLDNYGRQLKNCSAESFNISSIVECDDFVFDTDEINILNEVCETFEFPYIFGW